ncbi:TIGR01777 family oxidoreductase [Mucilaginibacter ginkgonis]|uniref:TIGR01777 family oxidoreductase n=1 Tax=Mucilaginibacter ginkgonis TaxID=2682091 RepID=UPI00293D5045|nr:TIGR01777 family oxidoreductase [Mucilaginibacter ginkgonis]
MPAQALQKSGGQKKRKQEIIDSRVKSISLIYDSMRTTAHQVKHVVSSSAVGYYGDSGDDILHEETEPGTDFLAECCLLWEQAVDDGVHQGLRVVKLRTGIVLSKNGGALPALALPVKFGLGTALGSGKQWSPWIHIDDAVSVYIYALQNKGLSGAYNMAAPNPVTNNDLTKAVAKQLHRPYWLPHAPAFMLKLILGERSIIALESTRVSSEKITAEGFTFKYTQIDTALTDIYG